MIRKYYDGQATESGDGSAGYEKWLDQPGVTPPSVEADQQVPRQAMVDALGNIPVAEAFKIAKCIDAEFESLIQSVENWEGKCHQAESEISVYKMAAEQMGQEIAALRESFRLSTGQWKAEVEEMKRERDDARAERDSLIMDMKEFHSLLNTLKEGYGDHFTEYFTDRINEALNKFTNNKDNA